MNTDANFIRSTLAGLGLLGFLALAGTGGMVTSAQAAGATVQVPIDQARVVELAGEPGTIVVGNPGIADVSLRNGNLLIVQGKSYGTTNIIVLTRDGEQIANMDVLVQAGNKHALSVFTSAGRLSYRCRPFCESELNAGDNKDYFNTIKEQATGKAQVATGAAATDGAGGGGGE
ncbi:MAG: pilus assembly protein N-terminal domain-containing protein [Pseudomonadota bacterium]